MELETVACVLEQVYKVLLRYGHLSVDILIQVII